MASTSPPDPTISPEQVISTPAKCIADFCIIPIGTSSASVSGEVADVQRLLQKSGLLFSMHSAGSTVEGPWEDVMRLIGQAHTMLHEKGVVRVQTDIRVGTRTDKSQSMADKVTAVERLLAEDGKREEKGDEGGDAKKNAV